MSQTTDHPLTLAIAAMGGQGGGVLSNWLIQAAEKSGLLVQTTSVPGVAQRTGSTVYYLEFFPRTKAETAGKEPIMALMPAPGDVDVVVAGELMEAGRAILRGFVTAKTTLICSTHRDYALSEKMAMGDGRLDSTTIIRTAGESAKQFIGFDMADIAESTGCVISSVLLGAISASNVLPISRANFEEAIRESGKGVESSLSGFASGYNHTQQTLNDAVLPAKGETDDTVPSGQRQQLHPSIEKLIKRVRDTFPESLHQLLIQGIRRLVDYQDPEYADSYLNKVEKILAIDKRGSAPVEEYRLTREFCRYLALWMSIEDGIRVADLKIRRDRFTRVRAEVGAGPGQIVRITEFMHPRVEEICDVLPPWLASLILESRPLYRTVNWICNRPRKVETTSLSGFLFLYLTAGLKRWRRGTYRFRREQLEIASWIDKILFTAPLNYELAVEIVECQRLIKGYGETYDRGLRNFHAICSLLHTLTDRADAASTVKELRAAALADETGAMLQESLLKVA